MTPATPHIQSWSRGRVGTAIMSLVFPGKPWCRSPPLSASAVRSVRAGRSKGPLPGSQGLFHAALRNHELRVPVQEPSLGLARISPIQLNTEGEVRQALSCGSSTMRAHLTPVERRGRVARPYRRARALAGAPRPGSILDHLASQQQRLRRTVLRLHQPWSLHGGYRHDTT